jgi:hypothetical protein
MFFLEIADGEKKDESLRIMFARDLDFEVIVASEA